MNKGAPSVLVIEDDADIASTIAQCLQVAGYKVLHAPDGLSAVHLVQQHAVSMVLLDWRLPGEPCGAKLVHRLRDLCPHRLPVVVISGDPKALSEAIGAGVEDYLPKPFQLEDLIHVVDEHSH